MPTVADLCTDLAAEQESLDAVLGSLAAGDWHRPTPAAGWDVLDSLSHLCFFEEAAALALSDPGGFAAHRDRLVADMVAAPAAAGPDVAIGRQAGSGAEVLDRWRRARGRYMEAVAAVDRAARETGVAARVPWYGPAMSPASFTTARILEAWAHGVDIRDGLARPLESTGRLRHVCHLGHQARAFTFAAHGVADPGDPVRIEVAAPDGATWTWGPEEAADRITGPALDVALVFAQRRHPGRTAVRASGPVAEQWLAIAQAFAGPPTLTAEDR